MDADSMHVLDAINLAHLLCGSEGRLAVIGLGSLEDAVELVLPILATRPSAVEILDETILGLAAANAEYRRYVELMPAPEGLPLKAVLYVEYFAQGAAAEITSK